MLKLSQWSTHLVRLCHCIALEALADVTVDRKEQPQVGQPQREKRARQRNSCATQSVNQMKLSACEVTVVHALDGGLLEGIAGRLRADERATFGIKIELSLRVAAVERDGVRVEAHARICTQHPHAISSCTQADKNVHTEKQRCS